MAFDIKPRLTLVILDKLRYFFLRNFFNGIITNKLKQREGECKMCGSCCGGCVYLREGKCVSYLDRPTFCLKEFPIDRFQQYALGVEKICGYKFRK